MPSPAAAALTRAIAAADPAVVLVPGTTAGRDYAPLVAARLGAGLAADCVSFAVEDGALVGNASGARRPRADTNHVSRSADRPWRRCDPGALPKRSPV